jgi:murein DD-endopeptidase MepM/ murein hydrolase activator NlpD
VAAVRPAHPRSRVRRGRRAACALLIAASAPLCAPGLVATAAGQAAPPATTAPAATSTAPATTAPATGAAVQQAAAPTKLAVGDIGPAVEALQEKLLERGEALTVDGEFGPMTKAAVERAQRQLNLPVTGIADQATLDALGVVVPPPMVCTAPDGVPAKGGKYLRIFPVAGEHNYSNDFGAPRHQGTHEGIDILSPRGTPAVAVANGFIKRMTRDETGLGGIWIWLEDDDGNTYYYAHLDSILKGIEPNTKVTIGQQLATVGNTGDARFGATHLHFEIHPHDGGAVNPYSDLRSVDPEVKGGEQVKPADCAPATPTTPTTPVAPPPPPPDTTSTETAPPPPPPEEPEKERPVTRDTGKEPKPPRANPLAGVELTVAQLRINQRISQAALRRINEVRTRLGGPRTTIKERPPGVVRLTVQQMLINQRISQAALRRVRELEALFSEEPLAPLSARDPDDTSRAPADVTLSADQMLINQRIAQAAVRRINALLDRLPKPRRATKNQA